MIGRRFGRLVVLAVHAGRKRMCECRCDCGGTKITRVRHVLDGTTSSCGCWRRERIARKNHRHGEVVGGKPSPEWLAWHMMRQRCENPRNVSYRGYGGRGIRVCARWLAFDKFLADMGRKPSARHSLDRIDVNGNYEPANCRWATAKQQCRNRTNNVFIEFRGERRCLEEWAQVTGLTRYTLQWRIASGWSVERALTQPARQQAKRAA